MPLNTMACGLIAGMLATTAAQAARVTVTVDGIRSSEGSIVVGLFDGAATFLKKALQGQTVMSHAPSVTLIFENVAPGRYAISAFHDRNGNGKLDQGAFGMPTEPFGFSRDARAVMGPPAFADAAVEIPAEGISLVVKLK